MSSQEEQSPLTQAAAVAPNSPSEQQQEQHEHQKRNHADVWSTRIQRELLALTTENADAETTQEIRAMLPPFCSVLEHKLDIAAGTCFVLFSVEIPTPVLSAPSDDEETSYATPTTTTVIKTVVVTLDVSLPKNSDGTIDTVTAAYPFLGPVALLTKGQDVFPPGSTIAAGDKMSMDLDWTPSLHLTDAILNLALKIKESVLQGEAFHPEPAPELSQNQQFNAESPVDEVAKGARRIAKGVVGLGSNFTKAFSPRAPKSQSQPVVSKEKDKPPKKKKPTVVTTPSPEKKSLLLASPEKTAPPEKKSASSVQIGDEINLLEEPWVDAHGVYSCKAIRRPGFIQDTIDRAAVAKEEQAFRSPTAMFRSFTQSARSVLEESFLMITDSHIIEMKASKLNLSCGTVIIAIPIDLMAKLKFRRQESVSLFFKPAPDDPLIYMCPDAGDAVHQIQSVLKRYGVKGKHTNAAAHRAISDALQLVQQIQTKELALKHDPTVERVNEIMDLYRQAAERFEVAGDMRHEEVVTHMRKFLALPLATSILDGSYVKPAKPVRLSSSPGRHNGVVPEGEILERTAAQLEDDDDHDLDYEVGPVLKEKEKEKDKVFEENMDNLLKEAQEDLQKFKMDDTDTASGDTVDTDIGDMAADLDAMMKEADKELADLMSS